MLYPITAGNIFFKDFIYLFQRERAQARGGTEGEGEVDSPLSREAQCGARSQAPEIMT